MGNFIGPEKITAMGEGPRYRVYQDMAECSRCRKGGTWAVLDTVEDVLIGGISYHREEDAEWLADQLNDAVAAERARVRVALIDVIADRREATALARPLGEELDRTEREVGADEAYTLVMEALDHFCPEGG